jgi:hypothetical protein
MALILLEDERSIPARWLSHPGFARRIRFDTYGNAIFSALKQDGLGGYEVKHRNFTGFAPRG